MNNRVIELYKQALTFAYETAGKDAGKGTIIESLTAAKFAELIVKECLDCCYHVGRDSGPVTAGLIQVRIDSIFRS